MTGLVQDWFFTALRTQSVASDGILAVGGGLSAEFATVAAAILAALGAVVGGIYANGRRGPNAMEAYNGLIEQLQDRVEVVESNCRVLEQRVLYLERENSIYRNLYGPLPKEDQRK